MSAKAKKRSLPFQATRSHHDQEAAEDYTELIDDLIKEKGEARTCDIADHLGISHVTAIRTLKRLHKEGWIQTATRKPVTLTKEGARLAKYARQRHELLVDFLVKIGVPKKVAETDVEGAEHHISKTTLQAISRAMKKL